jgi:predicted O-methyltransferase YrrM
VPSKVKISNKPYSWLTISLKYIRYYLRAFTRHQVHSPLVYGFIDNLLLQAKFSNYPLIEQERKKLIASNEVISFTDFGKKGETTQKAISTIAKWSLKPKKYAQLLAKTVEYSNAKSVLEIGTSLGITTAYMGSSPLVKITTLEGDSTVASKAEKIWHLLKLDNISCIKGSFDETIPTLAQQEYDIIYIDGNHKLAPTLAYFDLLQSFSHSDTLFIFDDIHYSPEMEEAWKSIKKNPRVRLTIDLFFLGYVYLSPSLSKQDFTLRF